MTVRIMKLAQLWFSNEVDGAGLHIQHSTLYFIDNCIHICIYNDLENVNAYQEI